MRTAFFSCFLLSLRVRSFDGHYFVQCSVTSNGQCLAGGGLCKEPLGENHAAHDPDGRTPSDLDAHGDLVQGTVLNFERLVQGTSRCFQSVLPVISSS